jgi:hypothetical protein
MANDPELEDLLKQQMVIKGLNWTPFARPKNRL